MEKKIAVPMEGGKLCVHFGHCESFYIASVNNNQIVEENSITPPAHEPGLYPKWIKNLGVECVIAGGMGGKAKELFLQENIKVFVGAETKTPRDLIEDYLKNSLTTGENGCNHDHK